jgi:hypothetical protein
MNFDINKHVQEARTRYYDMMILFQNKEYKLIKSKCKQIASLHGIDFADETILDEYKSRISHEYTIKDLSFNQRSIIGPLIKPLV